ncbi:unnamed protein product [Prorocentrum cordatum]|uniref:Uncharacterized protein n=1 Tax=Prorocentrum cordatum TaxID=2364126 RepID=A0ABN9PLZ1_9DINO|nr:unnamed protein product [Polarella glacialis]
MRARGCLGAMAGRPPERQRRTWKEYSGREAGKDGYVFGDIVRHLWRKIQGDAAGNEHPAGVAAQGGDGPTFEAIGEPFWSVRLKGDGLLDPKELHAIATGARQKQDG